MLETLESLARSYAEFREIPLIGSGVKAAGVALGGLTAPSGRRLPREKYFALLALVLVIITLAHSFLMLGVLEAARHPMLWLVLLISGLVSLLGGVFIGRLAAARATDSWGSRIGGALAAVPLLSLLLAFLPSSEPAPARASRISDGLWLLIGIVLLFAKLAIEELSE